MLATVLAVAYITAPVLCLTGWIRWARHPQSRNIISALAFASFAISSASVLIALGVMIYGSAIGGFPYYDPRLMRIYAIGLLSSLAGLVVGLAGLARPSPLRWHAPALSLTMLVLWMFSIQAE